MSLTKLHKSYRIVAALMRECWNIEGKKYESASGRKYMWRNWTNPTEHDCSPQVANAHRPKTASCRATNECEWVTPTSVASPRVQFSNKHQLLMITHENFWVMWLQSFFPSSWGVRSPDWLSSQSGNLTRSAVAGTFTLWHQSSGKPTNWWRNDDQRECFPNLAGYTFPSKHWRKIELKTALPFLFLDATTPTAHQYLLLQTCQNGWGSSSATSVVVGNGADWFIWKPFTK